MGLFDAKNIPLLGTALSVGGDFIGAISQGIQNRKQRDFELDMYNRQRSDALADWNMNNTYNAPSAQMARLKAAGLNPNLVYGNGSVVANTQAMPRAASSGGGYSASPPNWGSAFKDALSSYVTLNSMLQSTAEKAAKTALDNANLQLTAEKTHQTALTTQLMGDRAAAVTSTLRSNAELADKKAQWYGTYQEMVNALQNQTLKLNDKRLLLTEAMTNLSIADLDKVKQVIQNLKKDATLKDLQIQLQQNGFNSSDPWYVRFLGRVAGSMGINISGQ